MNISIVYPNKQCLIDQKLGTLKEMVFFPKYEVAI